MLLDEEKEIGKELVKKKFRVDVRKGLDIEMISDVTDLNLEKVEKLRERFS